MCYYVTRACERSVFTRANGLIVRKNVRESPLNGKISSACICDQFSIVWKIFRRRVDDVSGHFFFLQDISANQSEFYCNLLCLRHSFAIRRCRNTHRSTDNQVECMHKNFLLQRFCFLPRRAMCMRDFHGIENNYLCTMEYLSQGVWKMTRNCVSLCSIRTLTTNSIFFSEWKRVVKLLLLFQNKRVKKNLFCYLFRSKIVLS